MHSIKHILIANRGEIARRVIRTARKMGILTFAIYTEEEKNARYVQEADQSCTLGSGPLSQTFLNIPLIVKIAVENACDAIHPGYGFLSENAEFAEACKKAGLIFIGPEPEAIRLMGNKTQARKFTESLGIPIPFSISATSYEEVLPKIHTASFPVIIKASAGGGGKGMKIVHSKKELKDAWTSAGREALAYFGDSTVYLERYIEDARHVEVQILGDHHGNILHLYDRECTIQRRHQKIIEEAPSPTLTDEVRQKLLDTAVFIAKSMNYTGAGTLEFLLDRDSNFYFLEMNTRIQVEHPVTEEITGIDIVREQINIACGKPLPYVQKDVSIKGHAIECRIYAEDPFFDFLPSSGKMLFHHLPARKGIRLDTAFEGPATISSSFDPLIAKVTSHAASRETAIENLLSYLNNCSILGIRTNLTYLALILDDHDFRLNNISTHYCELKAALIKEKFLEKKKLTSPSQIIASALAFTFATNKGSANECIWQSIGPWRNVSPLEFTINEERYEVTYQLLEKNRLKFNLEGVDYFISGIENQEAAISFLFNGYKLKCYVAEDGNRKVFSCLNGICFELRRTDLPDLSMFQQNGKLTGDLNGGSILSPLNGRIIQLNVKEGDKVKRGEILMIIESMKMENKIVAPAEAVVAEVKVASGDQVIGSELLIKLTMLN